MTIPQGAHQSAIVDVSRLALEPWDESTKAVVRITDNQGMSQDCEFTPAHGLNAPLVCSDTDIVDTLGSAPSISLIQGKMKAELLTNALTDVTFQILTIDTDGKQVYP